jgi:hypothetical protein
MRRVPDAHEETLKGVHLINETRSHDAGKAFRERNATQFPHRYPSGVAGSGQNNQAHEQVPTAREPSSAKDTC